ncbi:MAG: hypothetical protein BWK80_42480 [Desulfobacteraceae bacterium IS3]|nr:MAG: hypothetical protein BWK80_42480 [Desulfobacteraceae bacterium IS3]
MSERTEYGLLSDRSNIRYLSGQPSYTADSRRSFRRSGSGTCLKLRQSLPAGYRKRAVIHTDFRESYGNILPSERIGQSEKKAVRQIISDVSAIRYVRDVPLRSGKSCLSVKMRRCMKNV